MENYLVLIKIQILAINKIDDSRFELIVANFSFLTQYLKYYQIDSVDGILADLGVSSHQFDQQLRVFQFENLAD